MSDDGDFYRGDPPPPGYELRPHQPRAEPPPAYGSAPGYGPPGHGQQVGHGQPLGHGAGYPGATYAPGYGYGYGYGQGHGYGYGYGAPPGYPPHGYRRPTNTLAILSLIFIFVFSPASLVLGLVARRQIRETGEEGDGMALAGVIVGGISVGLIVLGLLFVVVAASSISA